MTQLGTAVGTEILVPPRAAIANLADGIRRRPARSHRHAPQGEALPRAVDLAP